MQTETPAPGRGRWTLVAMALLFIGPVALAWILYLGGIWAPGAGANKGELLDPVVTLPRTAQPLAGGGVTEGGYLYGKWSIVHFADRDCDEDCAAALLKTRQVRLALGREIERIQRVAFMRGGAVVADPAQHPELLVVELDFEAGRAIASALERVGGGDRVYIVDPNGNLILAYGLDAPPADLRDDLKKLLRVSRIG